MGYFYYGFFGEGTTCYATQNKHKTEPWDFEIDPDVPDSYHHVNANFTIVCIWGFLQYLAVLIWYSLLLVKPKITNAREFGKYTAYIGIIHVAHFLTLMIMRWRHAGKVCSGDYLESPNRYSLFDSKANYLHDTGSFLYYAICS